uniref:Synaptonemal complex central element protein 3 n=1 Tax=Echeneis naucrates TaxID=173247 RepID=A0A665U3S1_ECHNA
MSGSPSPPESPFNTKDDLMELNKDLEELIDGAENMSVQLTWMAYDMVVQRTSPELEESMRKLEEAYHRCNGKHRENQRTGYLH